MKVKNVMATPPRKCSPRDSLDIAAEIMWEADCGCVPVCEGDRVVGMITDRDICMAAHFDKTPLSNRSVATVMSQALQTCHPEDPVQHAAEIMARHQLRRLPVIDEEHCLVGIVSLNDLVRLAGRDSSLNAEDIASTLNSISQHRTNSFAAEA